MTTTCLESVDILPYVAKELYRCDYIKDLEVGRLFRRTQCNQNSPYNRRKRGGRKVSQRRRRYLQSHSRGQLGRERKIFGDATPLALNMEEVATGQGMQEATGSWKRQREGFSPQNLWKDHSTDDPFYNSELQNWKTIYLCCSRSLNLG